MGWPLSFCPALIAMQQLKIHRFKNGYTQGISYFSDCSLNLGTKERILQ